MRRKLPAIVFISALAIIATFNSCKKGNQDSIREFLSSGPWEVASIYVFNYVGDTQLPTDTLNTDCDIKQLFSFRPDGSCTYNNFHCEEQAANGSWSLSRDRLFLISDIVCKDTSDTGSSKPFENSKIVNLGQYSMVLQTGDLQSNYFPNQRRRITQYGFIRQKRTPSSN
ncbi:hypothetical protein DJ568_13065 [Mucilaginibacter hurinus]|uniref:Lipocalin-like domain-containing protein n=1 Tax=Mucilaginibacter hurinus TaxID=2201324 RepID=A0A367GL71_9SPHI|nr:hypothetical protein [Mucilaginibacter hurinus]RCH54224.1 hypothetical protein DJ568_13065 [Mucilaginibacter hurinus]